jgi:hypothetical protein
LNQLAAEAGEAYAWSMAMSHLGVASILCGVMASFTAAKADTNTVQGLITGSDGKPLAHAEVRAERTDAVAKRVVTKTDANGHYTFTALPTGRYSISVVAERSAQRPAAATATVGSDSGQPIRRFISPLPYQVKADFSGGSSANVRSRFVWKPGETGSHIGGRWINAAEANGPAANPLQKLDNGDLNSAPFARVGSRQ